MKNKKRTFASMKKNILSKRRLIDLLLSSNTKPDAINRLMEVGKIIYVKKRTPIIEVGQVCDKGFFVLEGAFIARIYNPSIKKSRTQNFFLEDFNSFMSCEDSYFSGEKTNTDLLAIKDSMIIQFTKADLEKLIVAHPDLGDFFYNHILVGALKQEATFRKILNSLSNEEMYHYLINECNSVIKNVPSRYIAEFMGISAEWLSKTKKKV